MKRLSSKAWNRLLSKVNVISFYDAILLIFELFLKQYENFSLVFVINGNVAWEGMD